MSKKVKIKTITVELSKGSIELTIEDAKALHAQLAELFQGPVYPIVIEKLVDRPLTPLNIIYDDKVPFKLPQPWCQS